MRASVIIRAKNEARDIGDTLDAVFRQDGAGPFEVIVVDSGSADSTMEIAARFPTTVIQIPADQFTFGRALNWGIQSATGEFVVPLSAHSLPASTDWLQELLRPFDDPTVGGVYGRHIPRENVTRLELIGMKQAGVLSLQPRRQARDMNFSNANGAVRRHLALKHPFAEDIRAGEDFEWADWIQRNGWVVCYQPTAAVYHSHGESFGQLARRIRNDQPSILKVKLRSFFAYKCTSDSTASI